MLPLKDNLRYLTFAWVSVTIFALNVFVYIGELTLDANGRLETATAKWSPIRDVLVNAFHSGDPAAIAQFIGAIFAAMFLHGSFMHIFGNMCFFFTFAPALEARMGHWKFAAFYLVSGVVATLTFVATDASGVAHIMGASGAIGGVLGAYIVYFPRARVDGWNPPFTTLTTVSIFFLGEFLVMQWMSIWGESTAGAAQAAGVAYWAHIGGIAFGMAVASLIVMRDHGLLGRKQSIFYIVSAAAIAAAVLLRTYAGGSLLDAIAEALFVSFISNLFLFPRPIKEWCSALAAPCITLTVFALLGFCVLQVQLFWHSEAGFSQVLNVGIVAVIVMLVSVVLSVSARRLPLKTKPIVVVPQVRREDRIMSEVVLDLVVGFFRFVSDSFQGVFRFLGKMLSIGLRSTMRMLLVGGTAVIPLAVQARLSYWRVRLQVGLNRLSKPWRARTSN